MTTSFAKLLCVVLTALTFTFSFAGDSKKPKNKTPRIEKTAEDFQAIVHFQSKQTKQKVLSGIPKPYQTVFSTNGFVVVRSPLPITQKDIKILKAIPGVAFVMRDQLMKNAPNEKLACPKGMVPSRSPASKSSDSAYCVPAQVSQEGTWFNSILRSFNALKADPKDLNEACPLSENCTSKKREKLWAQRRVDADLMNKRLDEILAEATAQGKQIPRSTVGVVDSGFDTNGHANSLDPRGGPVKTFKVAEGVDSSTKQNIIGNPINDENGHGTMVSGTIRGKDGMGVAPRAELSVYRATRDGDAGSTSNALLLAGIEKSCEEQKAINPNGVAVVNLSWGSWRDESGQVTDEEAHAQFLKKLAGMGCLVVKSAGNSNVRGNLFSEQDHHKLDDAYLRVAAVDPSGRHSYFSTLGEVAAPGEGVFSLESTRVSDNRKTGSHNRCGEEKPGTTRFVSGTSFSAPITAGLASQVVLVLMLSDNFKNASPETRVALTNRIIKASAVGTRVEKLLNGHEVEVPGSVNGLRAVEIAHSWVKETANHVNSKLPSVAELNQSLEKNKPAVCEQTATCDEKMKALAANLADQTKCEDLKQCFESARAKTALCTDPSGQNEFDLAQVALGYGYLETASNYAQILKSKNPELGKKTYIALAEKYFKRWEGGYITTEVQQSSLKSDIDLNNVQDFIDDYMEYLAKNQDQVNKEELERRLFGILGGDSAKEYLARGPNRGSEEKIELISNILFKAVKILGVPDVTTLLEKMVEEDLKRNPTGYEETDGTTFVASARILNRVRELGIIMTISRNALIASPHRNEAGTTYGILNPMKDIQRIDALEAQLLERISQRNDYFANQPDKNVFFSEYSNTREYFDPMLFRLENKILERLGDNAGTNSRDVSRLSSLELFYLLDRSKNLSAEQKTQLLTDALAKIGEGKGWDDQTSKEIVERRTNQLQNEFNTASPARKAELQKEFLGFVENLPTVDSLLIVNRAFKDEASNKSIYTYTTRAFLLKRMAEGYLAMDEVTRNAKISAAGYNFINIFSTISWKDKDWPKEMKIPQVGKYYFQKNDSGKHSLKQHPTTSRLNPPSETLQVIATPNNMDQASRTFDFAIDLFKKGAYSLETIMSDVIDGKPIEQKKIDRFPAITFFNSAMWLYRNNVPGMNQIDWPGKMNALFQEFDEGKLEQVTDKDREFIQEWKVIVAKEEAKRVKLAEAEARKNVAKPATPERSGASFVLPKRLKTVQ